MNDLLQAAKAVIECWSPGFEIWSQIADLRAAVDRAENTSSDFYKWWDEKSNNTLGSDAFNIASEAWTASQQAERERCREIVITMGGPDVPDLLKHIDSGEE